VVKHLTSEHREVLGDDARVGTGHHHPDALT
jgi:hypothetical protein